MNSFARPRKSATYSARCPRCQAPPGCPCSDKYGQRLTGVHFERDVSRRREIHAAMYLYAPLSEARYGR